MTNTPPCTTRIIQILPDMYYGDAIGNDCLAIRDCLKEAGYGGDIYAERIDPRLAAHGTGGIRHISDYHDDADIIICHVSVQWDYMRSLCTRPGRKLFIYHNITPSHFFAEYGNLTAAGLCEKGRKQLQAMRLTPSRCLAASAYNKADLEKTGYLCPVNVLPIICQFGDPPAARNRNGCVTILFVGRLAPNKKQQDIIQAFAVYHRDINPRSRLVLVGGGGTDDYTQALMAYPGHIGLDGVTFTGHVSDEEKDAYYRSADIFLCLSEHEGFCVPLLEAMHYGIPIIAYDSSAVAETLGGAGLLLERKEPELVAEAIDLLATDAGLRDQLIASGRERLSAFAPDRVQATLLGELQGYAAWWRRERTIYFDATVQRIADAGTGIQRLEKEELKFLYGADCAFKTVPFYFDGEGKGLFECETGQQIAPQPGDIIYSPDLSLLQTVANRAELDRLHASGIKIWFFIHDLIPIHFPETCSDTLVAAFKEWLRVVFRYTGIVGNSKATIQDVKNWLAQNQAIQRSPGLLFEWVWSGCDFSSRSGIHPGSDTKDKLFQTETATIRLLMVSTIEPRKMYDQAVKAFDLLRKRGVNVRLDIVGREGWKVQETVRLIETSPNYQTSLFWHKGGIRDEELCSLYEQADAVIFASKAEGFGLAITEGAYHKKPLILRDIPVFREIAGEGAFYFSGFDPEDLANAVEDWISLFRAGKAPSSDGIHLTSWQEHGEKLLGILTGEGSK